MQITLGQLRQLIDEATWHAKPPKSWRDKLPEIDVEGDDANEAERAAIDSWFRTHGARGIESYTVDLKEKKRKITLDEFNNRISAIGVVLDVDDDDEVNPKVEFILQDFVPKADLLEDTVIEAPNIRLHSDETPTVTKHHAPDGARFNGNDLLDAVVDHEQATRKHSKLSGSIDRTHIYFEGLRELEDNSFEILWGS